MAIYALSTLGASDNQIVFNDFNYLYQTGVLYRMQKRTLTRRELEEFDIPLPESSGVADFQSFIGKSYFILEGTMYPDNETYFDTGREKLRKVSSLAVAQADNFADLGYVPYQWTQTNGDRVLNVKVMYVDIPENSQQGIVQPFRILCKVKYPVIYSASPVTAVLGTSSPSITVGNSLLSFHLPTLLGASTYTYAGTLVNAGDLPTYPGFVITGPVNHPRLTNNATGEFIDINVNLGASDTLAITYNQDAVSITENNVSVYNKLSSDSTLFTIRPGNVNILFTGSSVGTGAQATINFLSAWPLS